jgi:hypothetical protein
MVWRCYGDDHLPSPAEAPQTPLRVPSVFTATAIIAATETIRALASSHRYGHSPTSGRSRNA